MEVNQREKWNESLEQIKEAKSKGKVKCWKSKVEMKWNVFVNFIRLGCGNFSGGMSFL